MYSTNNLTQKDKKDMKEKRIVEREFLGKVSSEELVTKIIASKLRERRDD